jgi:predicted RNA-binding protein with PUA-like domain
MYYLLKTEPSEYSFADLRRDGKTLWDGVTNPQAVKFLRSMNVGDLLVIYHTGDERQAVGTAQVAKVDASDPKTPKITIGAGKSLKTTHALADLKANKLFADSPLVRQSRLSVVPLTEEQYKYLLG